MPGPSSTRTDAAPSPAVRAEALTKTHPGGVRALDAVAFSVPPGELVGLVGANGSGKTTLLKVLSGVLAPDAGKAEVLGMEPRRHSAMRARTAYAGQDPALDPEMTGLETLRLFHALRGLPSSEATGCIRWMVESYGLAEIADRRVATYSGGERQRLHLALSTLHGPEVLLLDEPAAGLDPGGRGELWQRLATDCRERGRTALVAAHDLAEVERFCDRVLLLHAGRLLADGPPAGIVAAHARARSVVTLSHAPDPARAEALRGALAALDGSPFVSVDGATVTLSRDALPDGPEPALERLSALGLSYRAHERREADLADAYARLTGGARADAAAPRRGGGGGGGGGGRGGGGGG